MFRLGNTVTQNLLVVNINSKFEQNRIGKPVTSNVGVVCDSERFMNNTKQVDVVQK